MKRPWFSKTNEGELRGFFDWWPWGRTRNAREAALNPRLTSDGKRAWNRRERHAAKIAHRKVEP